MRCPVCRRKTFSRGNPYRPFCSQRCKLLDLDNWLSGGYRISRPLEAREKARERDIMERGSKGQRE